MKTNLKTANEKFYQSPSITEIVVSSSSAICNVSTEYDLPEEEHPDDY